MGARWWCADRVGLPVRGRDAVRRGRGCGSTTTHPMRPCRPTQHTDSTEQPCLLMRHRSRPGLSKLTMVGAHASADVRPRP